MSALDVISELFERGITVRVNGPNLRLKPAASLTPNLIEQIKADKTAVIRSLQEIEDRAGPDWDDIANNPEQLKAFVELRMIEDMRQQGIVPDHYTATTECKRCGPVPIWKGCAPFIAGCPWCFNRVKGLPMPAATHN